MIIQTSTLRPGLLVSLKTSVVGNVKYAKTDLEEDHLTTDGVMKARWETLRTISDPAEHEAAIKVRTKARTLITSVCASSAFGLLCPEARAADLEQAIAAARLVAEEFNSTAKLTRLQVYIMAGRIAPDDVEAVRAINSEVRDLLKDMQDGVASLDVRAIREAATKARNIGAMLSDDAQSRIKEAIDAARKTARDIVQAGEQAAQEVDKATIAKLKQARTSFLDMDGESKVAAPKAKAKAVDFEPTAKPTKKAKAAAIEME